MTMIFHLLLFTCACALGAAGVVPANGDIDSVYLAIKILEKNVVSMDGNVPNLDDSRRHYAAIVHVVSKEAVIECNVGHDYYRDYQSNVNTSLTYADAHPQEVIDITKKVIEDVVNAILQEEQEIRWAAESAASQLIDDDVNNFASTSQNLSSHNFVITGAEKLRNIVLALSKLYKVLYGPRCDPRTAPLLKTSI